MTTGYWCGKPLEDFTKEQLIQIILSLAEQIESLRDQAERDIDFLTIGD